jgi:hypothetical protein
MQSKHLALAALALFGLNACENNPVQSAQVAKSIETQAQKTELVSSKEALPTTWTVINKNKAQKLNDSPILASENPIHVANIGALNNIIFESRIVPTSHFIDDWQGESAYMLVQMDYNGNGIPEATYVLPSQKEISLKSLMLSIQEELRHPNKQMRKRPEVIYQAWDDVISEHVSEIQNNPLFNDDMGVEFNPLFHENGALKKSPEFGIAVQIDNAIRGDQKQALFGIVLALNNTKKEPITPTAAKKEGTTPLTTLLETQDENAVRHDRLIQSAFKIIRANYSTKEGVLPKELESGFQALEQFTLSTAVLLGQDNQVNLWAHNVFSNQLWNQLADQGKYSYKIGKSKGLLGTIKGVLGKGIGGGNLNINESSSISFVESTLSVSGGNLKLNNPASLVDLTPLFQLWSKVDNRWKCEDKCECKPIKGDGFICGSTDHL